MTKDIIWLWLYGLGFIACGTISVLALQGKLLP